MRGAVAAVIFFAFFDLLFTLYCKRFLHGNGKYGAVAASLVLLIAWLWFFALLTVIGGTDQRGGDGYQADALRPATYPGRATHRGG
jgi:hypothetical protein